MIAVNCPALKMLGPCVAKSEEAAATLIAEALDWFAGGMDFADALHLASRGPAEGFEVECLRHGARQLARLVVQASDDPLD